MSAFSNISVITRGADVQRWNRGFTVRECLCAWLAGFSARKGFRKMSSGSDRLKAPGNRLLYPVRPLPDSGNLFPAPVPVTGFSEPDMLTKETVLKKLRPLRLNI